jgi:hypothetical protein
VLSPVSCFVLVWVVVLANAVYAAGCPASRSLMGDIPATLMTVIDALVSDGD